MIAVETSLLVLAHRSDAPGHEVAADVLRRVAEGPAPWALPWMCVHEFLAIVTNPAIFAQPTPVEVAMAQVDAWLSSPMVIPLSEGPAHGTALRAAVEERLGSPLWQLRERRLAAICAQHGVRELWSTDEALSAATGVAVRDPLLFEGPG
jgi:hypothetical protein